VRPWARPHRDVPRCWGEGAATLREVEPLHVGPGGHRWHLEADESDRWCLASRDRWCLELGSVSGVLLGSLALRWVVLGESAHGWVGPGELGVGGKVGRSRSRGGSCRLAAGRSPGPGVSGSAIGKGARQRFAPGPATDGRVVCAPHRHRHRRGSPGPRRPGTGRVAGWGGRRVKRGGGAMGDRRGGVVGAAGGGRGGLWGRSVQRATTAAVAQPLRWARSAAVAWPLGWATGAAPCEMGAWESARGDQARCRVTWGALGQQGGGGGL
jgi:hypothetical protein